MTGVLSLVTTSAGAQLFYAGVRGGAAIPTGDFAGEATPAGNGPVLRGATPGLGYGLDAGVGMGLIGFYASYDKIKFGCASESCALSAKYELTGFAGGVRASVPLMPLIKPWAKAGITYNEMNGTYPGANGPAISTGKSPGFEVGAGLDIPVLMGFFNLTPQVRHVRQKMQPRTSSSTISGGKRSADYFTFDIGLRVRSPL